MNESRPPASFVTTHWSLVLAAGQRALPESEKALAAGWKRSTTRRAKRRMTDIGTSAPRYHRGRAAFLVLGGFFDMP